MVSPPPETGDDPAALAERIAGIDVNADAGAEIRVAAADRFFVPLRLACESKQPRIVEVALHCIQKLIAYGYVGSKTVLVGSARKGMMDVVMETICACKDMEDEPVQLQIVKAVLTAVTAAAPGSAVHDTTLLLAVKTCFYIYLVSKSLTIQSTANATLTQMLNVVFARLESAPESAPTVTQRDAFLVFRSLCKLSMKALPDQLPTDDSIELRSKLLSLQLLYSIIQNAGERFRAGDKFIWAIRQYLCLSLLKNGVSPIASILQLSLDIFVTLIRHFKARTARRRTHPQHAAGESPARPHLRGQPSLTYRPPHLRITSSRRSASSSRISSCASSSRPTRRPCRSSSPCTRSAHSCASLS